MTALDRLIACAGNWSGTNRLQVSESELPEDSPSTAIVTPVLAKRFVRIDYTWAYHEKPQEGSFLIGYEAKTDRASAHWIDSWHMSNMVMVCSGIVSENGGINVLGSYAAPPGPDWGWRVIIGPEDGQRLSVVMFNIDPDGREYFAVESIYTRA
jgi:Protein of unknown function (DUF1579)